jgi:hypothetical protein
MSNKIIKITEKLPVETTLEDGTYFGTWSGYIVEIYHNGKKYELTTEVGVRGMGFKVVVFVKDGVATFNEVKN